ncbi:MAG TPA: hypothetical protein VH879_00590 [Gemmatimonadales bacterium]
MNRRVLLRVLAVPVVALAVWLGRSLPGPTPASPPLVDESGGSFPASSLVVVHPGIGFRDPAHLDEHFRKHGAEFGEITVSEYLRRAQALRDGPAGGAVLEAVRRDGVVTRFNRRGGDFIAFDPDLTIRTYFRPNGGEGYFRRQLHRYAGGAS